MTQLEERITALLRERMSAAGLDYKNEVASVIEPQNASYCAVTFNRIRRAIKIISEMGSDLLSLQQQIDGKIVEPLLSLRGGSK